MDTFFFFYIAFAYGPSNIMKIKHFPVMADTRKSDTSQTVDGNKVIESSTKLHRFCA